MSEASDLSEKDNRLNNFLAGYFKRKGDEENFNKYSARITKKK